MINATKETSMRYTVTSRFDEDGDERFFIEDTDTGAETEFGGNKDDAWDHANELNA